MTKIVYSSSYGGFGLSHAAEICYRELTGNINNEDFDVYNIDRADPILVQVVEALGDRANGDFAKLCIAEVPAGTRYHINEYDGYESVMTIDDYEWKVA
jgi:hypothetical protein